MSKKPNAQNLINDQAARNAIPKRQEEEVQEFMSELDRLFIRHGMVIEPKLNMSLTVRGGTVTELENIGSRVAERNEKLYPTGQSGALASADEAQEEGK